MAQTIKQLHRGYRFMNPQFDRHPTPNAYKRSTEPRRTTDSFLLAAAGLDTDTPKAPWYRQLTVVELGLLILAGVAVCVVVWQGF